MDGTGDVVAVTGAAGYLGRALVRALEDDPRVAKVVALDRRLPREPSGKVAWVQWDVTKPGLEGVLSEHGVTRLAHLAFLLDPIHDRGLIRRVNVEGSKNVLAAAGRLSLAKVVFSSSSVVYGARPDNPSRIPEDFPCRPTGGLEYAWNKVEVERFCRAFVDAHPETGVVVLRVVTIVGPGMDNFLSRFLQRKVVVVPSGRDPAWQFVHEWDCAEAFRAALFSTVRGTYNVGADDPIPFSEVTRRAEKLVVRMPRLLVKWGADLAWRLRLRAVSEIPGALIDYLCYVPVLDNSRIKRDLGFHFRYTSAEAIDEYFRAAKGADGPDQDRGPDVLDSTGRST